MRAGEGGGNGGRPIVLVVDDEQHVLEAVRKVIEGEFGAKVQVRLTATIREALAVLRREHPAGAIVDIKMGRSKGDREGGLRLVARMRRREPLMPVLVYTGLREWAHYIRSRELGADYWPKGEGFGPILGLVSRAIRHLNGRSALASAVAEFAADAGFTPCEARVFVLTEAGWTTGAIGQVCQIRSDGVRKHRRRIRAKIRAGKLGARASALGDQLRAAALERYGIAAGRLDHRRGEDSRGSDDHGDKPN